ncbi:TraB/GumN family protein [Pontixanthobacter luteolus]|uniref:TraB/GumN family protein n=1 Tax=Pontixanthobacter luteolus TaxID=295089 RepID=UPI002303FFF8|nr:TraB/GumN family protein [Pontixanthobacter luteolus]
MICRSIVLRLYQRLKTNKRTAALVFLPILLASCSQRDDGLEPADASPALWLVENGEGETEGWLFGTIHALPDDVRWQTPALRDALRQSVAIALEISADDQARLPEIFGTLAATPGLPPLHERVDPARRAPLQALLDDANYRSSDFTATETWAAALTLASASSSGEYANGVDRALSGQVGRHLILEGAANQLSIFDSLPEADQRDLLQAIIDDHSAAASDDEIDLVTAWLAGDMEGIALETNQGMLADPELRAALLVNRNRDWADKVDGWMQQEGPITVAAGAAHMAGPDGLPTLLRAKGYAVRRVQ